MKYLKLSFILIFVFILSFFAHFTYAKTKLSDEDLYCTSDLVMDFESENILFKKNSKTKVYPASTTKILTAILAIEKLDLNKTITISKNAIDSTPYGSSVIYLKPQEVISTKDVLYGLLIKSGNDAANVLAEEVSGNIDDFVKLMNEKLKEIGCINTHFTNPHGFHDNEHYTTAYDMAKLMKYAMENDTFRKIVETKEYTISATNLTAERIYQNTNKMFNESYPKMYYEYVLGGKTGYTDEARGTFIGYGKKDDKLVIVAAFNGSQNISGQEGRFLDSITLFEYAFNNFNRYKIFDKDDYIFSIKDDNTNTEYTFSLDKDLYGLYNNDKFYTRYQINITNFNLENIYLNDKIGTLSMSAKGESLDIEDKLYNLILTSKHTYIDYKDFKIFIYYILIFILSIIWLRLLVRIIKPRKKKKAKKKKVVRNKNT